MRVLLVEDHEELAETVANALRREGMAVDVVFDGTDALGHVGVNSYDVVVLDRDLPGVHADQVCRSLIAGGCQCRILMLTAAGSVKDRVEGLGLGADDYLPKPFAFTELVARIRALYRRSGTPLPPTLASGDLLVDPSHRSAVRGGRLLALSPKEFAVLEYLLAAQGRIVPAEELLERVWDEFADPFTGTVKVTIRTVQARGPSAHRQRARGRLPDRSPVMPRFVIERILDRRLGLPRPTARLRLTFFYGGLFLVAGAGLLAITYLLVRSAPIGKIGTQVPTSGRPGSKPLSKPPPNEQALESVRRTQALVTHAIDLHELLTRSGVALAIMAVLAVALGWLVAGRVLRPLRTIKTAAQRITASNLHERLALRGPDDEFKDLGGTLNDLLGRLEASFYSQENFVANASHELRTPLTLERSLLETALADPETTAGSWRATGQRLLTTNRQQAQLIDALLTLACSQRGLEKQHRLDLALIAEDVLDIRDHEVARRGLSVEAVLNSAPMVGDPDLIESLVANLVDNALRHNIAGGRIEIATGARSGAAVISVGNTGPIIPEDETTQLLQPFQRLSGRTRSAEGHGVGLAIVQAITIAHRADLTLHPRSTGGLDVEVHFQSQTADPSPSHWNGKPVSQPSNTSPLIRSRSSHGFE